MKHISPMIYEKLTPRQRIIATVEAEARDDQDEVRRLVKSCPKKTYLATDAAYQDKMVALMSMSLAVQCDLQEQLINLLLAQHNNPNIDATVFLQNMTDTQAGWHAVLETLGIDPDAMKRAGAQSFQIQEWVMTIAPPPIPENVQRIRKTMEHLLDDGQ